MYSCHVECMYAKLIIQKIFLLFSKNNLLIYGMIPDYLPEIPSGLIARLVRVLIHILKYIEPLNYFCFGFSFSCVKALKG